MRGRRLLVLLVVALVASGCVSLQESPPAGAGAHGQGPMSAEDAVSPRDAPVVAQMPTADPPRPQRDVAVNLSVEEPWIRPRQAFDAYVDAPPEAALSWFVWTRGGDAFVEHIAGYFYVGGAPGPLEDGAHAHGAPAHAPLDTGDVSSGASTRAYAFWKEGRYEIVARGVSHARVNLTVNASEEAREVVHATLVEDEFGLRFSPADIALHPTTRVRFWNAAATTHAFEEARFLASVPVASDARALRFMAVHPGAYELLVVAREAPDGQGEVARPFVIDFESPPTNLTLGPWEGRVSALATPATGETSRAHTFAVAHPLRALRLELRLDAATQDALPPEATWRLTRDGVDVASAGANVTQLLLGALPAGEYALHIDGAGAMVNYRAWGEARHRLEAPVTPP